MVGAIKYAQTKKPSRNGHMKYVNFDFEDETTTVRCIMWPEEFHRSGDQVKAEEIFYIRGKVDRRGREPNIIVNKLLTLDDAEKEFTNQVVVRFRKGLHEQAQLTAARDALQRFPGETDVVLLVESSDPADPESVVRYRLMTPGYLRVTSNSTLRRELSEILGEEFVLFHSPRRRTNGAAGGNGHPRSGDAA